jgi:hypothetical protein
VPQPRGEAVGAKTTGATAADAALQLARVCASQRARSVVELAKHQPILPPEFVQCGILRSVG